MGDFSKANRQPHYSSSDTALFTVAVGRGMGGAYRKPSKKYYEATIQQCSPGATINKYVNKECSRRYALACVNVALFLLLRNNRFRFLLLLETK